VRGWQQQPQQTPAVSLSRKPLQPSCQQ
jgi:hypothetical protein